MRSRRQLAVVAFAALFVALVLVAAPHSASVRWQSVRDTAAAGYTVTAAEAPPVPIAVSADQVKRAFSFDAVFAFLAIALATAPALLLRIGGGAPPFARA